MSDTKQEQTESNILYVRQNSPNDGYAEVSVSPDKMTVFASIYPASDQGQFLPYPLLATRLEENGIIFGVLHEQIQASILTANTTKKVQKILIAQGEAPVQEIPEHFVIRKDLITRKPEIDPDKARVDWHSISAFTIVKLKEPIARRIAKNEGKTGKNVYGEETSYSTHKIQIFTAGKNVIDHPQGLFAGKSGRLDIQANGEISIEEVLVLKKGVDFTTGNISFPGDVILQGKIADGFTIYSGGSVVSSEVIDATEIVTKKDLIAQSGIEGGSKGAIRVGGKLEARYIQNCRVAVRGDIKVSGSIMQSRIYTMGSLIMGETGKLVSSECIVIGNVQVFDIGNPRSPKAYIRCGTDFTIQQELDIANEQLKKLSLKIQQAEEIYKTEPLPDLAKYIEEAKQKKIQIASKIPTYLPRIDKNDSAFIEVRGTVYPGTEIEICHVPFTVTKIMKQIVFKLDKSKGAIISEPWKKQN